MTESLEQLQTRHLKELKDVQGRITNKKKNATKKTRKFVNDECAELERILKERHDAEFRAVAGEPEDDGVEDTDEAGENDDGRSNVALTNSATNDVSMVEPVTADTTRTSDPKQHQQQQQPGKKRNRQKERLARRAAEQEAAVEAAAVEASNMVDHRSVEAVHMARELATHSLVEREMPADGHCLFSAVADQLSSLGIPLVGRPTDATADDDGGGKGRPPFRLVRWAAARYIESHADDFAPFLEEPLEDYLHKIRDLAEWGGHMELLALASTYDVEIRVIADGRTAVVQPAGREQGEAAGGGDKSPPPRQIWLAYYRHGFGLGEHYNSLRKRTAAP